MAPLVLLPACFLGADKMKKDYYLLSNRLKNLGNRVGLFSAPSTDEMSSIWGVSHLAKRLRTAGGYPHSARMIRDKRRSLDKAVLYSYQGAFVKKIFPAEEEVAEEILN